MTNRVRGSILIGIALVAAALVLSQYRSVEPLQPAQPVVTGSVPELTAEPLRAPIPVEDSDGDGVPDWQELLNETEPLTLTETVEFDEPETLTEQFALDFFETYMRNEGFGAFARPPEEIISTASDSLINQTQDTLYTFENIETYAATPEDVRRYANAVASIMFRYPIPEGTRNEIVVLEEAVALNDGAVLSELAPSRLAYTNMVQDMLALPVPEQVGKEHLDLTNSYQALASSLLAMEQTFTDPLRALLRLQRYQQDADGLVVTIENLFTATEDAGANFEPGDRVFDVVKFE